MYVALLYGSRLCKKCCTVFSLQQPNGRPNKLPLPWQEMKDAYLCLSLHNVYLEVTCFTRPNMFISSSAFWPVSYILTRNCVILFLIVCYQGSLQLWMILSSSSVRLLSVGGRVHSRTRPHFCVYLSYFPGAEKWAKTSFWVTWFDPYSVAIQKMFLVSELFIVSVCYLYTTGFEINNLVIMVLWTTKQLALNTCQ